MTFSLRLRVLALIAAGYAAMFTVGGFYLYRVNRDLEAQLHTLQEALFSDLSSLVPQDVHRAEDLNVRTILEFNAWTFFDDAVVLGKKNLSKVRLGLVEPGGDHVQFDQAAARGSAALVRRGEDRILAEGIHLNPAGSSRRLPDFDREMVLGAIWDAMAGGRAVEAGGGRALPIEKNGQVWGGYWVRKDPSPTPDVTTYLLPAFVLSTLLITVLTYLVLGKLVVEPVELLAGGARGVQAGDFSVRLAEPSRRDELADLVRTFNQMTATVQGFNDRLEDEVRRATELARRAEAAAMTQRRLAAMGELAAGIAHEINNPLGGMINAVEALEREDLPADRRRSYRELVRRGLARIGDTVHRLRRFTPRDAPHGPVDLVRVVEDSIDLVRHRARRLGIALEWTPPAGDAAVVVSGASNELGQAVLNLLANALDALEGAGDRPPSGGRIEVTLRARSSEALLRVRDDGPGVSAVDLVRVSDLFFTTKEVGKGTGLGLALVHTTVREHHGRISITSEPGEFFCVELRFPLLGGEENP